MNRLVSNIPEIRTGQDLLKLLESLPEYDKNICNESASIRLMELENIYNIYIPSQMSCEIYNKLYMSIIHSLIKKDSKIAIRQGYENFKQKNKSISYGLIGGSDSFTITGVSGIGKSATIERAIEAITENKIICVDEPYLKVIPCLIVQCPFDCSVKGLLLEILRKVDEELGTDFHIGYVKNKATVDVLIGAISQVCLNHVGLLIVDEIQNVVNNRKGYNLVAILTQLINSSGISICMVGTPEAGAFFERENYLARRAIGLKYSNHSYNDYFEKFCTMLFKYQYIKKRTEINKEILDWLYEHSRGILSNVIALFHDAQEIAIMTGKEVLSIEVFEDAYKNRMENLHNYIETQTQIKLVPRVRKRKPKYEIVSEIDTGDFSIKEITDKAKRENLNVVELLKEKINVVEVLV